MSAVFYIRATTKTGERSVDLDLSVNGEPGRVRVTSSSPESSDGFFVDRVEGISNADGRAILRECRAVAMDLFESWEDGQTEAVAETFARTVHGDQAAVREAVVAALREEAGDQARRRLPREFRRIRAYLQEDGDAVDGALAVEMVGDRFTWLCEDAELLGLWHALGTEPRNDLLRATFPATEGDSELVDADHAFADIPYTAGPKRAAAVPDYMPGLVTAVRAAVPDIGGWTDRRIIETIGRAWTPNGAIAAVRKAL